MNLFALLPYLDPPVLFSADRLYRYWWSRRENDKPPLIGMLINPSIADEKKPDPTATRMVNFALGFGYGGVIILNPHAIVDSDPGVLDRVSDPVGPDNDRYIVQVLHAYPASPVLVGWGVPGKRRDREMMALLRQHRSDEGIVCLGVNGDGTPRHPLYLAAKTPLQPYSGRP